MMNEFLCHIDDKYMPISFHGIENTCWEAVELLAEVLKSEKIREPLKFKDDFIKELQEAIIKLTQMGKNKQFMEVGVGRPDFTKCVMKTNMEENEIRSIATHLLDFSAILKKGFNRFESVATEKEGWFIEVNKLHITNFKHDDAEDMSKIKNSERAEYEKNCYVRRFFTIPYNIVKGENGVRAIASGKAKFKKNDIDNYQTKGYALFVCDKSGYVDADRRIGPLSKARTFSTAKNAENFAATARYESHVVELLVSFYGIVPSQKPAKNELLALEARAEKNQIKQMMSSENIEKMQLENLAFKRYCQKNNIDYQAALSTIYVSLENFNTTKQKTEILKTELESETVSPIKPRTKTL